VYNGENFSKNYDYTLNSLDKFHRLNKKVILAMFKKMLSYFLKKQALNITEKVFTRSKTPVLQLFSFKFKAEPILKFSTKNMCLRMI
jgi:hypothetical protein